MESNPLVSVILITHNRIFSVFERSLNSVIYQTHENIEVIIVDTSTDAEIAGRISEYADDSYKPMLQYISQSGISNNKARNVGFEASGGEYVAFLDDDDEWAIDKIEKQLKWFSSEIPLVYSNYEAFDSKGNVSLFFNEPQRTEHLNVDILGENKIGCTSMPLIKRQAFIDVGGFDESFRANQDWDLWIRLLQNHNAAYSPDIAGIKHYSEGGISSQKYRRLAGWTSIFINHASKYNKNRKQLKKALGHFIWEMFDRKLYLTGVIALPLYAVLKA